MKTNHNSHSRVVWFLAVVVAMFVALLLLLYSDFEASSRKHNRELLDAMDARQKLADTKAEIWREAEELPPTKVKPIQ